jgi:hypothetical protein
MMLNNLKLKNIFYILLYMVLIIGAHLFPVLTFLSTFILLMVSILKKSQTLKIGLAIFLFIFWPVCFYFYFYFFVQAIMTQEILINTYENLVFVKFNLESFGFWALRLAAMSSIQLPLLNLEIDPFFMKQFVLETYYCVALICESFSLNLGFYIFF